MRLANKFNSIGAGRNFISAERSLYFGGTFFYDGASTTSITFYNLNIGEASVTRTLIIPYMTDRNTDSGWPTISVDGTPMSYRARQDASTYDHTGLAYIDWPTKTTANINFSTNGTGLFDVAGQCFCITGKTSVTPLSSNGNWTTNLGSGTFSRNVDTGNEGWIFAVGYETGSTVGSFGGVTKSWTSPALDNDTNRRIYTAYAADTVAETKAITFSYNLVSGLNRCAMYSIASWV